LNKLVEDRANLEASSESIKSKLERTKLQLDGAQTKTVDLERLNDELKRTNTELTRQLEKWQSLETKEGEAADTERKQRIALEMELRDVSETYEKMFAKTTADVERANARVEKMKSTVRDWEVSILFYNSNLRVIFLINNIGSI
jgi:chromosome segregation ATPase